MSGQSLMRQVWRRSLSLGRGGQFQKSTRPKKALGPYLTIIIIALAICGGIAVNTVLGGPEVPVLSPLAAIILGVVAFLIILKQLGR